MPIFAKDKRLKMDDAITYEICVQGFLEDIWSDRLAQLNITSNIMEGSHPESQLVGRIRDQFSRPESFGEGMCGDFKCSESFFLNWVCTELSSFFHSFKAEGRNLRL